MQSGHCAASKRREGRGVRERSYTNIYNGHHILHGHDLFIGVRKTMKQGAES